MSGLGNSLQRPAESKRTCSIFIPVKFYRLFIRIISRQELINHSEVGLQSASETKHLVCDWHQEPPRDHRECRTFKPLHLLDAVPTQEFSPDVKPGKEAKKYLGNMGTAILAGLLDAIRQTPGRCISRVLVSTKTAASAGRIRGQFPNEDALHVAHNYNVQAMEAADIVILAFKPHMAEAVLGEDGVARALAGKLVISIMGGKPTSMLERYISRSSPASPKPCFIRAMPNMAARIRKSMTIIQGNPSVTPALRDSVLWIFECVGEVRILAADVFDAGSMLVGSSMAVLSVGLDGVLDGCVMEGLGRPEALEMAAHCLLGMAELFRQGEHPAQYRESVSSPRGSTITGLLTVETAGVRGSFAQAMVNGTKTLRETSSKPT